MESRASLLDIGALESLSSSMPDMENFHLFLRFQHAEYRTVNVRLTAVRQMPELVIFGCSRTTVRMFFQVEDRLPEPAIPFLASKSSKKLLADRVVPCFASSSPWRIPSCASARAAISSRR
jgi:hypothetical protein